MIAQEEHYRGGEKGDDDHQYLAALGRECVVNSRHPDVSTVARRIADAGKGHENNQDAIYFAGEEETLSKYKSRNNVNTGIDGHEDDACRQNDCFSLGYPSVNDPQKSG